MINTAERRLIGQLAEDEATKLLQQKGMRILDRNWRGGRQEIDIVAQDGDTLVFVEVRARKAGGMVSALQSISYEKQKHMVKGARMYLGAHRAWRQPCRFDVVAAAVGTDENRQPVFQLEHIPNVIELRG